MLPMYYHRSAKLVFYKLAIAYKPLMILQMSNDIAHPLAIVGILSNFCVIKPSDLHTLQHRSARLSERVTCVSRPGRACASSSRSKQVHDEFRGPLACFPASSAWVAGRIWPIGTPLPSISGMPSSIHDVTTASYGLRQSRPNSCNRPL